MHRRLEHMKETLMHAVEMQLCDLSEVDTKELGEAIDMIKDLEEAIYYCTVIEAMKKSEWDDEEEHTERMYYDGKRYKTPHDEWEYLEGRGHKTPWHENEYDDEEGQEKHRDEREGRSPTSRRMYMEAKEMKKDKASQLRELEKYMQELSQDITEMITDASPEEKQYLEKKITTLAGKIGQMK